MMSSSTPNTPGACIKLRLPLIVLVTSFGFVRWPRDIGGCSHLGSRWAEKEQKALYGL